MSLLDVYHRLESAKKNISRLSPEQLRQIEEQQKRIVEILTNTKQLEFDFPGEEDMTTGDEHCKVDSICPECGNPLVGSRCTTCS